MFSKRSRVFRRRTRAALQVKNSATSFTLLVDDFLDDEGTVMTRSTRRHFLQTTAAAWLASSHAVSMASAANEEIRIGFIGCGGRGGELMGAFEKVPGVRIVGLCDPDASRLDKAQRRFPEAKTEQDIQRLLDRTSLDAVVIATCNHWHCLAAIWAMQAGKDVYVEKPLSHSQWEGEQTVVAATKYQRICQVGTQQRSDPMQAELKAWLHQDKALGPIRHVRVNRYGVRGSIGKRSEPLKLPAEIDYERWLGPAQEVPLFRNNVHYDWHWDWNTGSGEMGNWGIHVLDDVRNVAFQDSVRVPKRILAGGGRLVWDDAGQTPNVHCLVMETGSYPVVMGLSNLPAAPDQNHSPDVPGPSSGYVVVCEGGRLEGQRGSARAYDASGKVMREFRGDGGSGHAANFIAAVRTRDRSQLNADVQIGHDSTSWCNYANIAYRCGEHALVPRTMDMADSIPGWRSLIIEMHDHLSKHKISIDEPSLQMSAWLDLDPKTGRFIGDSADRANALWKREYRPGFVVPDLQASL